MKNEVNVVIGSWGSYNECNERALGSKWLTFNDYSEWEEIEEELKKQGFELDGIDEELFIQDIEGIGGFNCDYMHPERLFKVLKEAELLEDEYKLETARAFIEAFSWDEFEALVDNKGGDWNEDIFFYKGMTTEEVLEQMVEDCYNLDFSKLGWLSNYITIDYEQMARDSYEFHEVEDGVLERR